MRFDSLPGGTAVDRGLRDIAAGARSNEALLVMIGAPRLRGLGLPVPIADLPNPEAELYERLAASGADSAHSRYNALIRLLVSFERAFGIRRPVDADRARELMRILSGHATTEGRVYFTGGVTALLMEWRTSTIAVDIKMVPEQDSLFRALPPLKELLEMNVELASPDDFIPPVPGWEERSPLIRREGKLSFHHYDFYSQALAKIERRHSRDVQDVAAMLDLGLIDPRATLAYFDEIEPSLYRYPAVDPASFRRAVEEMMSGGNPQNQV